MQLLSSAVMDLMAFLARSISGARPLMKEKLLDAVSASAARAARKAVTSDAEASATAGRLQRRNCVLP